MGFLLTVFFEMVRLFMYNTLRPPTRLSEFWIDALRYSRDHLAPVIGEMDLFPGLNQFDVRLRDSTAVELLEVLKCLIIVFL